MQLLLSSCCGTFPRTIPNYMQTGRSLPQFLSRTAGRIQEGIVHPNCKCNSQYNHWYSPEFSLWQISPRLCFSTNRVQQVGWDTKCQKINHTDCNESFRFKRTGERTPCRKACNDAGVWQKQQTYCYSKISRAKFWNKPLWRPIPKHRDCRK